MPRQLGPISRLFVRIGGTLVPLPVERVSRFEADGDYVIAHAANGTTRPWNVLNQPRSETIWNWATTMTRNMMPPAIALETDWSRFHRILL